MIDKGVLIDVAPERLTDGQSCIGTVGINDTNVVTEIRYRFQAVANVLLFIEGEDKYRYRAANRLHFAFLARRMRWAPKVGKKSANHSKTLPLGCLLVE